jgi:CheY-like chemotaxis protein
VDTAGEHDHSPTNVRRLQPLRILLVGRDRRFLRVTSFLLSRRGYHVVEANVSAVVEAVERERADIVLLEPSESKAAAARTINALQATAASPALLLVTDEKARWNGLRTVDKWTPMDELVKEIEAAAFHRLPPAVTVRLGDRESGSL